MHEQLEGAASGATSDIGARCASSSEHGRRVAFWSVTRFPETRRDDVVEVLHGRSIADPYRWLEDPDSAETADWVKRQNEFTAAYLESLPDRPWFLDDHAAGDEAAAGRGAVQAGRPLLRHQERRQLRTRT